MKSFSQYLSENNNLSDRAGVEHALASYKQEHEIVNPEYQNLVGQVRRIFGRESEQAKKEIFQELVTLVRANDSDMTDLYYGWPSDSFASFNKFEKTLTKLHQTHQTPEAKKIITAGMTLVTNWKHIAADLKALKDKVVKVSAKREQAKEVAAVEMKKKFTDSSSLIKVLESHLNEYKAVAEKRAKDFVHGKMEDLRKAGFDLNVLAPMPSSTSSRTAYQSAQMRRSFYISLTDPVSHTMVRRGEPEIRVVNTQKIAQYVHEAVAEAEANYRAFMQKMIEKIGKPVVDAKMTGSIWVGATLTVKTNDGEEQVWNTQMIINFSKYQKMFNQFPSRRKK